MTDWYTEIQETPESTNWYQETIQLQEQLYDQGSAGTFETVTGEDPRKRAIREAPNPPGMIESLKYGTIEDIDTQIRHLAKRRFPDMPEDQAISRYGVMGEEIVYVGDDGSIYKEFGGTPSKIGRWMGRDMPAMVGATMGGLYSGPPGAAAGGMAGMFIRKKTGEAFGDPRDVRQDTFDLAVEGMLNAGGWKLGEMIGGKVVNRRVARDIKKFDKKAATELMKISKEKFGIELTPAEASDLGSLLNQQTRLGMGFDEAGDIIRSFYQRRATQKAAAVDNFIGKSPPSQVASKRAKDVASQYVDDAVKARETGAGPLYKTLFKKENLVPEKQFMKFEEDDYLRGMIDKVMSDPKYDLMDAKRNSLAVIDQAKKLMDDEVDDLLRSGRKHEAGVITSKKNQLLKFIDDLYPGYSEARGVFAAQSSGVREAEESLLGQFAKLKNPNIRNTAEKLFSSKDIDVTDVMDARRVFQSQGKIKEWDDLLNVWLRKQWGSIKPTQAGNDFGMGAKFKQTVFGSKRQQEIMRAAMGPSRYRSFEDLMKVLEATGKVTKGQSMTEPAQRAAREEAAQAAPVASYLKEIDVTRPASWFNLNEWWIHTKTTDWNTKIAKIITNPDSIKQLEKLRTLEGLSPVSQQAIDIVSMAIVKAGAGGAADVLNRVPDQEPEILNQ